MKTPAGTFEEILKFMQKCKEAKLIKKALEKKNKTRDLTLPDFKTYCKSRQYGIGVKVDRLIK